MGVAFVVLAACSGGGESDAVTMTSAHAFQPKLITIHVGDTVTWENSSSEQHTVTAEEDSIPDRAAYFASGGAASEADANDDLSAGLIGPGDSYSHTFDTPGIHHYYCIPHKGAGMSGTIVVEEG